jgi:hypothetical protein
MVAALRLKHTCSAIMLTVCPSPLSPSRALISPCHFPQSVSSAKLQNLQRVSHMASLSEKSAETQRINTTIETTLLLRICNHVEKKEGKRLQMSEVLRIVLSEYATQNTIV